MRSHLRHARDKAASMRGRTPCHRCRRRRRPCGNPVHARHDMRGLMTNACHLHDEPLNEETGLADRRMRSRCPGASTDPWIACRRMKRSAIPVVGLCGPNEWLGATCMDRPATPPTDGLPRSRLREPGPRHESAGGGRTWAVRAHAQTTDRTRRCGPRPGTSRFRVPA